MLGVQELGGSILGWVKLKSKSYNGWLGKKQYKYVLNKIKLKGLVAVFFVRFCSVPTPALNNEHSLN